MSGLPTNGLVISRMHPHGGLQLTGADVHIWCLSLDGGELELAALKATLSPDERARAERFFRRQHADRFIAARGQLRRILAAYVGAQPRELRFHYGEQGKPALAPDLARSGIRFNLSHSHDRALLAVARGREVGIDVEFVDRRIAYEQIAIRFFSAAENAALGRLPAAARSEAFFRCWTRKEAYIKARGEGLSHSLGDFDVTMAPGEPARLLATRSDPAESARWSLEDCTPAPAYAAALAVEGPPARLVCWSDLNR